MIRGAAGRTLPFVVAVLLVWTVLRAITTVILVWIAQTEQDPVIFSGEVPRYFEVATLWDGGWYERIATQGYPAQLPVDFLGQVRQNEWAFYPVFPYLARGLMELSGWPFAVAAPVLATVLGYAAALVIAGLLRERVGVPAALGAVTLLGAFPAAPALQVAYTESLALLLLGTVLWLLVRRRWWWAAAVALLTGLARPIALPLGLVALVAVLWRWRARDQRPLHRGEVLGMLATLVSCGVSGLIWPVAVWWSTGRRDGYPVTMSAWRGGEPITAFVPTFEVSQLLLGEVAGPTALLALALLLLVVVLGPWAAGLGVELRTWCLAYPIYLAAALDPWTSIYRYLLPLFPLLVLLMGGGRPGWGARAAGSPGWLLVVRTLTIAVLFVGWQVWWSWELFRFEPPSDYPP
ncbi:MAG: hypothetical protein ACR2FV_07785 [Ornithinimicrobium sp.]|uniref:hypothetical protein n=1 Tax=Ornithinimicrobium sp. TaxID=1977084 RepID=UPI003D9B05AE